MLHDYSCASVAELFPLPALSGGHGSAQASQTCSSSSDKLYGPLPGAFGAGAVRNRANNATLIVARCRRMRDV